MPRRHVCGNASETSRLTKEASHTLAPLVHRAPHPLARPHRRDRPGMAALAELVSVALAAARRGRGAAPSTHPLVAALHSSSLLAGRVIEVRRDRRRRAPIELLGSCSSAGLGGAGKQPSHLRSRGLLGVERGHVGGERKRSRVRLASKKYVPSSPDNASRVAPQIPRSCQLTAAVNTEVADRIALHDVD